MSRHARPEETDWNHYTYESHMAVSLAFERFAVVLRNLGFGDAGNMASEEAKASWDRAEELKHEREETDRTDVGTSAETQVMQKVSGDGETA